MKLPGGDVSADASTSSEVSVIVARIRCVVYLCVTQLILLILTVIVFSTAKSAAVWFQQNLAFLSDMVPVLWRAKAALRIQSQFAIVFSIYISFIALQCLFFLILSYLFIKDARFKLETRIDLKYKMLLVAMIFLPFAVFVIFIFGPMDGQAFEDYLWAALSSSIAIPGANLMLFILSYLPFNKHNKNIVSASRRRVDSFLS